MKNLLLSLLLATCSITPLYLAPVVKAQASDWGCQVILCLSNPGGPTQYGQCRPPIQKLWRELARGHAFPTCSGVGFQSSRPGYEPYYCETAYRLKSDYDRRGRKATCVSTALLPVRSEVCSDRSDPTIDGRPVLSPHWRRQGNRYQCVGYPTKRPNVRSQPHYVDVSIDGKDSHRVWY
ncbi:hypothetical protein [Phyllobacterium sp. SB3]|uniref:hypothetical protein n=1 Tax=Phyllobacterium sp. SB3 TaxID=3156073 RepID=UPI0032AEEF48